MLLVLSQCHYALNVHLHSKLIFYYKVVHWHEYDVIRDLLVKVQPVFYSDPTDAVFKALGVG